MGIVAQFKLLNDMEDQQIREDEQAVCDVAIRFDLDDPFEGQTCLEKDWHALHYVLCQSEEADGSVLGDAVLGGKEIGPEMDYGQIRLLDSRRVKEIDKALQAVDLQQCISDVKAIDSIPEDVYHGGILLEESHESLQQAFNELLSFYREAAQTSHPVLLYLT